MVKKAARNRFLWSTRSTAAPKKSAWLETYWPEKSFIPPRVQSRIAVFKIAKQPFYYKQDPLLGWGERSASGVDVRIIPGGKHLLLLREPYVRALSTVLQNAMNECPPARSEYIKTEREPLEPVRFAAVSS
jgi:hypothetical protein